jgi:hypothetical protein
MLVKPYCQSESIINSMSKPKYSVTRIRLIGVIGLLLVLISILLIAFAVWSQQSRELQDSVGEAHILFRVDHRVVMHPNDCVTVSWAVDHIKEVYFNTKGVAGTGSREFCGENDNSRKLILHVIFVDGTQKDYTNTYIVILDQLGFVLFMLLLFIIGGVIFKYIADQPIDMESEPMESSKLPTFFQLTSQAKRRHIRNRFLAVGSRVKVSQVIAAKVSQ